MRRAVARGRVFPQSYSTDRRYGHLSLKAGFLYPMMWANADDQGRLCGDPEEIKYSVCPMWTTSPSRISQVYFKSSRITNL